MELKNDWSSNHAYRPSAAAFRLLSARFLPAAHRLQYGSARLASVAFLATVITGVLGTSATVDFKLQQAKTSSGGTAKDIPGAAITQIVKATGDNKIAQINLDTASLDSANGYGYVAMICTVGTAASLVAATLEGFDAFNDPASLLDPAAVVQTVSV